MSIELFGGLGSCIKVSETAKKVNMMDRMIYRKRICSIEKIFSKVLDLLRDSAEPAQGAPEGKLPELTSGVLTPGRSANS